MKVRNLILGLKDQGPFTRFVRNLMKGHVLGLFTMRSHLNADGRPKVKYNTKATAEKSAQKMSEKTGKYFSNYKCIYCDYYHIGRNK